MFFMVDLSSKENLRNGFVEICKGFTCFGIVDFASLNSLFFSFEVADSDKFEVISLIEYSFALRCMVCIDHL